jgi:hypothetical protein
MIMDNYEKSVYDFNDYINKVIDDNEKIQTLLGNTKAKPATQVIPKKPNTPAVKPANKPAPVSGSTTNSNLPVNSINSVFSREGFKNENNINGENISNNIRKIKEWFAVYIKKILSGFYIKRNTIYIKA